jgi:hypothetical protein
MINSPIVHAILDLGPVRYNDWHEFLLPIANAVALFFRSADGPVK